MRNRKRPVRHLHIASQRCPATAAAFLAVQRTPDPDDKHTAPRCQQQFVVRLLPAIGRSPASVMRVIQRVIVNSCEPTRRPVLTPLGPGGTRSQRISRQSRWWGTISGPEQEWGEGGAMRPTRSAVAASLHAALRPGTRADQHAKSLFGPTEPAERVR